MKTVSMSITLAALLLASAGSADLHAEGVPQLQRLALCQDTWFDWKDDARRMQSYSNYFETKFDGSASDGSFTPKSPTTAFGGRVSHVYPGSVGTGVGFSLTVNADHAQLRAGIEKQLGKAMTCETGEGTRACELQLGPNKTVLLMTDQNGRAQSSLVGCYYYYEK